MENVGPIVPQDRRYMLGQEYYKLGAFALQVGSRIDERSAAAGDLGDVPSYPSEVRTSSNALSDNTPQLRCKRLCRVFGLSISLYKAVL